MSMIRCTLSARAYHYAYGEDGYSQAIKQTATGTMSILFDLLPRKEELIQLANGQEFTVKNVTHHVGADNTVSYSIDLGAAGLGDAKGFDEGLERWRTIGFAVTVEEKSDAS